LTGVEEMIVICAIAGAAGGSSANPSMRFTTS
jgi:hypothetical protein